MSFYRHLLLLRSLRSSDRLLRPSSFAALSLPSSSRSFAFASAEEAAAERRRRKRRLRIEPPLHALRRDPSAPRPPRDPNAPRLPDSTSALVGPRLNLHNRVQSLIRGGDLDAASSTARHAVFSSVRPTVFTCNAVTASMLRSNRLEDVVTLFHFFFVQNNIVPNVVSYNILINSHCNAGRVDTALEVYRHILDNAPFSPSYVTYRHLTKGLVDADRIQEAVDLLREMLNRGHGADSLVYNTLMQGFIDRDNMDKAMELFDELRERCQVYDGTVHATLMEAYWKRGDDKAAMDSYQSLLDRQFNMTPATCNALIETLFKHDKMAEANRMFERMLNNHKPPSFTAINTETYNVMVNQKFKEGKFMEAIEVFHQQPTKPCMMDVGCFNNIIGKLCENGLVSEAEKLFGEMPEKSVYADTATYGFLVDGCFKEGKVDLALSYFEKMIGSSGESTAPKLNVGFYNKMFDGLVNAGRTDRAIDIFGQMVEKAIRPTSRSYEILVNFFCKEENFDVALKWLEHMLRSRVIAAPEFRAFIFDAFGKAGRAEDIERLFAWNAENVAAQDREFDSQYSGNTGNNAFQYQHGQAAFSGHSSNAVEAQRAEWMPPMKSGNDNPQGQSQFVGITATASQIQGGTMRFSGNQLHDTNKSQNQEFDSQYSGNTGNNAFQYQHVQAAFSGHSSNAVEAQRAEWKPPIKSGNDNPQGQSQFLGNTAAASHVQGGTMRFSGNQFHDTNKPQEGEFDLQYAANSGNNAFQYQHGQAAFSGHSSNAVEAQRAEWMPPIKSGNDNPQGQSQFVGNTAAASQVQGGTMRFSGNQFHDTNKPQEGEFDSQYAANSGNNAFQYQHVQAAFSGYQDRREEWMPPMRSGNDNPQGQNQIVGNTAAASQAQGGSLRFSGNQWHDSNKPQGEFNQYAANTGNNAFQNQHGQAAFSGYGSNAIQDRREEWMSPMKSGNRNPQDQSQFVGNTAASSQAQGGALRFSENQWHDTNRPQDGKFNSQYSGSTGNNFFQNHHGQAAFSGYDSNAVQAQRADWVSPVKSGNCNTQGQNQFAGNEAAAFQAQGALRYSVNQLHDTNRPQQVQHFTDDADKSSMQEQQVAASSL